MGSLNIQAQPQVNTQCRIPEVEERQDLSRHYSPMVEETELNFDTGLLAWLQVLAYQTYYERNLLSDFSSSSIAWIGSLQSCLLMVVGIFTGPLFDAGYFYGLTSFAAFVLPFALMMTSISTEYWQLILAQGLCVGLAAGCLLVPSIAVLPQYFRRRIAFANGVAASGSSIGGVIYPIMFDQLRRKVGFAWATRGLGFVCFATVCISMSIMRVRITPKEKRKLFNSSAFKEPTYCLFAGAMFLGFLGFYNFLFYVQTYAIETGIVNSDVGFYLVPMLNAASTFGRILPNLVADHTGPLNMLTPAVLTTSALAFIWISVHDAASMIVLTIFYGFLSGGFVSLPPVVMASLTSDMRFFGTRLGMLFAIMSIGLLVGTPIGGAILSATQQYLGVQLFTASCLGASAILLTFLRFMRSGFVLVSRT
ncbi:Major facilitator superfamily domain general substrate transporter [Penicillium lagena]|uniref:Major facilitator superfamily domain general substrate transporter n=1 Tax=Penicillium lagena TaxID=94218 RepID=UPI002541842B|nr:Major facilitator superfamily domain general substrate transporter [Penicillium lagena]KAJ5620099.1 Major facilitator superfamily domain general substrate transporter [Penicillium lagena]